MDRASGFIPTSINLDIEFFFLLTKVYWGNSC